MVASPLDEVNETRFGVANFSLHGIAPIGRAAFAIALAATADLTSARWLLVWDSPRQREPRSRDDRPQPARLDRFAQA